MGRGWPGGGQDGGGPLGDLGGLGGQSQWSDEYSCVITLVERILISSHQYYS